MSRSPRHRRLNRSANPIAAIARATHAAIEMLEQRRMLSAGDLDPNFGAGGIFVDAQPGSDFGQGMAIQSDGSILAVGTTSTGGVLARYTDAGAVDLGFGASGRVDLSVLGFDDAIGVASAPGNKIVVVGTNFSSFGGDFVIARFNADGSVDEDFNGNGDTYFANSAVAQSDTATGVVVRPDGTIVVAGTSDRGSNALDFALFQLDTTGAPDGSFGASGWAFANFDPAGFSDTAHAVALQGNGFIVVAGETINPGNASQDFAVARFDLSGGLDGNFSANGMVSTDITSATERINSIALGSDGSVYFSGFFNDVNGYQGAVGRYDSSGTFDTTFGAGVNGGLVYIDSTEDAFGIAVDDDGYIFAAAVKSDFTASLSKLEADGDPETNFAGGEVVTPVGSFAFPISVAVQDDGKVVIFGTSDDDFMLLRYGEDEIVVPLPVANAGPDQNVNEGALVNFNAGASTGSNLSYQWDLDGDGFDDGTGPTASRTFGDNGNFVVSVRVTDDQNVSDVSSLTVFVANVAPNTAAVGGNNTTVRQLGNTFTGSFNDPGTLDTHEVSWNFGDGNTIAFHSTNDAGALTPTHAYTSTGTFIVSYTIKDDDAAQVTKTMSVTVSALGIVSGNLVVGGTSGNDDILVKDLVSGIFKVRIGGVIVGQFTNSQITKIILLGGDGDDDLTIEADITKDSEMYGGNGEDVLKGGGGQDMMFGGAQDDKLKARNANDVCVGGDGADTIAGGDGRDILIGGLGADKIAGQDDSDILVAGNTSHDNNIAALAAIRSEWATANPAAVTHIRNGSGGLNGSYRLASGVTVFDDAAKDTLAGGSGQDWFIATLSGTGVLDKVTGLNSADFIDDLEFILS